MTDSDDFLNAGIDSLGGADADSDPSIGATPEQIDQLESETRNVSPETPLEDMSGNDSAIGKNSSDTTAAKSLTGWHPFMRFLFRVADMKYAYVTPREKRAYLFISRHKKTFWACFWGGLAHRAFRRRGRHRGNRLRGAAHGRYCLLIAIKPLRPSASHHIRAFPA